jgi:hypothetical protein
MCITKTITMKISSVDIKTKLQLLLISGFLLTATAGCKKSVDGESQSFQTAVQASEINSPGSIHFITEDEANTLVRNFKERYPNLITESYTTRLAMLRILNQKDLKGVRYYFGREENNPELFFVGADNNNDDLVGSNVGPGNSGEVVKPIFTNRPDNINWNAPQLVMPAQAAGATRKHRETFNNAGLGGTFEKDAVVRLINQRRVAGVRSDFGLSEDGVWVLVMRAVDRSGKEIKGMYMDRSMRCPPVCGGIGILNS